MTLNHYYYFWGAEAFLSPKFWKRKKNLSTQVETKPFVELLDVIQTICTKWMFRATPKKKTGKLIRFVFFPKKKWPSLPPPCAFRKDVARSSPNSWPAEKPWKASANRAAARVSKLPWHGHQSSTSHPLEIRYSWSGWWYIFLENLFLETSVEKWLRSWIFGEKWFFGWVWRLTQECHWKNLRSPQISRHLSMESIFRPHRWGFCGRKFIHHPPPQKKKKGFQLPGDSKWPFWDG